MLIVAFALFVVLIVAMLVAAQPEAKEATATIPAERAAPQMEGITTAI
jgi:hypothetical protein